MICLRLAALLLLLLCFPELDGKFSIQSDPTTRIDGGINGFLIAEGVAFSPSGNCLAVAWAKDNAIALYKRLGEAHYDREPACVIRDSELLGFAHDLAFSPCGRYLAVASREVQKVVLYKMDNMEECRLRSEPCQILESCYPSSLCFSPDGKSLAVCNRKGGRGITFYKMLEDGIETSPYQEISEAKLLEYDLGAPHGIAFLPDSTAIAVVHKQFYKTLNPKGSSGLAIIDVNSLHPVYIDFYANEMALHSIDCHPVDQSLVVVDEISMVSIYEKIQDNRYSYSHDLPIHVHGGTAKGSRGVAFSSDGKCLAVTTREPSVMVYSLDF